MRGAHRRPWALGLAVLLSVGLLVGSDGVPEVPRPTGQAAPLPDGQDHTAPGAAAAAAATAWGGGFPADGVAERTLPSRGTVALVLRGSFGNDGRVWCGGCRWVLRGGTGVLLTSGAYTRW